VRLTTLARCEKRGAEPIGATDMPTQYERYIAAKANHMRHANPLGSIRENASGAERWHSEYDYLDYQPAVDNARANHIADMAAALRAAKEAHTAYEASGAPAHDWPDWYAEFMVDWFGRNGK
jgi:hypothetical protein